MRGRSFKLIDQGFFEIRIDELEILGFEPLPKPSDDHARRTVQDTPYTSTPFFMAGIRKKEVLVAMGSMD